MYLINSSSIKEFLYDAGKTDLYGVRNQVSKSECLDVGNQFNQYPYPYVCLDKKAKNFSSSISARWEAKNKLHRV